MMSHHFWPVLVLNVSSAKTKYLQIRSTFRGSISEMQCISWKTIKVIRAAELHQTARNSPDRDVYDVI